MQGACQLFMSLDEDIHNEPSSKQRHHPAAAITSNCQMKGQLFKIKV